MSHFSAHYGLPQPCRARHAQRCFQLVLSHAGEMPTHVDRSGEGDADVEWAPAIAPKAKIVFVQFNHLTALFGHIGGLARRDRPSVVSDSWCEPCGGDGRRLPKLVREVVYPFVAGGCHLPHVVCVQAAGDHRIPGDPPSNSPYVLAVGGTEFKPTRDGSPSQEILWPFSGSGVTTIPLPRPPWQKHLHAGCSNTSGNFSCTKRAVPDVSATAASVPDFQPSRDGPDWFVFSGTSLSTPLWAGLLALADQQLLKDGQQSIGINELHQVLYRGDVSRGLDDIAPHGWDWDTELGSPKSGIVPVLARAIEDYRATH